MSSQADVKIYRAFGLTFASDLEIPELAPGSGPPDVTIRRLAGPDPLADSDLSVRMRFREQAADGAEIDEMIWRGVGAFVVKGDDQVVVTPTTDSESGFVTLPLLGPVMAVLLHRRGLLVLHGSAVLYDGRVWVFLGDKGAGKSTTAAGLVRDGGRLLTDDLVALEFGDVVRLWPGSALIKLTPSAAEMVEMPQAVPAPSPHPDFPKQLRRLPDGLESRAFLIDEVFVLARGAAFERRPLSGPDALTAIMRFSYLARFGDAVLRGQQAARHFRQCAGLSAATSVSRLTTPDDLAALAGVADFLLQDAPS